MPVYENERGTYIFNSKDLNMIEYIDQILDAGIDSLKIEGRMKTALYVATVARTYRKAIEDEDGRPMESAPHPKQMIYVDFGEEIKEGYLLRRREEVEEEN